MAKYDFECLPGWMSIILKRNNLVGMKLHKEANENTPEEEAALVGPWIVEFHKLLEYEGIDQECMYNAYHTGMFYQKLPKTLYINKKENKKIRGCKQMKDNKRVTLMVCSSTVGKKCLLLSVGKLKIPKCFSLTEPPFLYTHHKNAWFHQSLFKWWINRVFWPWHKKNQGDVTAVLLVDNCGAHKIG